RLGDGPDDERRDQYAEQERGGGGDPREPLSGAGRAGGPFEPRQHRLLRGVPQTPGQCVERVQALRDLGEQVRRRAGWRCVNEGGQALRQRAEPVPRLDERNEPGGFRLAERDGFEATQRGIELIRDLPELVQITAVPRDRVLAGVLIQLRDARSEERRVGKEYTVPVPSV